jgi:general secretion pathway protein G
MPRRACRGLSLIELLIVLAIIGAIISIALPGLLRARIRGNEVAATSSLDAINTGQAQFLDHCGGFASTIEDLVTNEFLSADLPRNGVVKSGYRFAILPDANAASVVSTCTDLAGPVVSRYLATADPVALGTSGTKFYSTNAHGKYESPAPIPNPIPANTPPVSP